MAWDRPRRAAAFSGGQVLVFHGGLRVDLAIPSELLLAIEPAMEPRRLLHGPSQLAGLVEWRGRIVPLVDLAARLKVILKAPRQTLFLATSGHASRALAVTVGAVTGMAMVPAIQPPPSNFGVPENWIIGAARLGQRPLLVLNPSTLAVA